MYRARDVRSWAVKVARADCADFESDTRHEAGAFLLPILGRIACTIEAEIYFTYFVLISSLPVLDRDFYEHKSAGLGVEVSTLYIRAEDADAAFVLVAGTFAHDVTQALAAALLQRGPGVHPFYFPPNEPCSVVGIVRIALASVNPSGGDDFVVTRL